MRLEYVKWRDASVESGGWEHPDDTTDEDVLIESVGWVVKETERYLTLAMDLDGDGQSNGRGRIPKAVIIERREISHTGD